MDRGTWWATVHRVVKSQTRLSDFTFTFYFHALEEEIATHSSVSCLENPRDGGAWWAAVYGVVQSQTRLKRLRSSSSGPHCGVILPPRGQLQYLETFLVVIIGMGGYVLLASMGRGQGRC